ncbi:MAG: hypothetical protein ACPGU1_04280 [Myxococcota bacterium]
MPARHSRVISLIALFALLGLALTPLHAKSKKAPAPAFLKAFSKNHNSLIAGMNLVPNLRAALSGPLAESISLLSKSYFGEALPLADFLSELNANAAKLPTEVAFGLTDRGVSELGRMTRLVGLVALASTASDLKDAETLGQVHGDLAKEFKRGGVKGMTFFINLTSKDMAKGLFEEIRVQAKRQQGTQPGLTIDIEESAIGVTIDVVKAFPTPVLSRGLVDLSVVPDGGHPATSSLVGALGGITQQFWLEQIGDGFRFHVGKRMRRSKGLRAKKLGPAFRADGNDALWGQMTTKPWSKMLESVETLVTRYEKSPAMVSLTQEFGALDNSMGMGGFVDRLRRGEFGKSLSYRLWHEEKALKALTINNGVKKSQPLKKSSIAGLLPGSATLLTAQTNLSVSALLGSLADGFSVALSALPLAKSTSFVGLLEALETLVSERADEVFGQGAGSVVGWGGDVQSLRIVRASKSGDQRRLEGKHLPHYGMAFLFGLAKGADGLAFGAEMLDMTGQTMCAVLGGTFAKDARVAAPHKLGLGTPTVAMPWTAMSACQVGKTALQVDLKGDLLLHVFQLEDVLVVSTSKALSTRIAATHAGVATPYTLPKPPKGQQGKLVGFDHLTGNALGAWVDSLRTAFGRLTMDGESISDEGKGVIADGPDAGSPVPDGPLTTGMKVFADGLRLLKDLKTTTTLKGRTLTGQTTLSFR